MSELIKLFNDVLEDEGFIKIVLHSPKKTSEYHKVICRRIILKAQAHIQLEKFTKKQAFHENVLINNSTEVIANCAINFKKADIYMSDRLYNVFINDDSVKIICKNQSLNVASNSSHNRKKQYLLPENTFIEPLVDLGVMTAEGKIINSHYDKYKQINRFVEIINDALKGFGNKKLNIVDFGCGKSYLTFVLYYFLETVCNKDISIVGLDLKKDVIDKCNLTAQKYRYDNLKFYHSDIKDYVPDSDVDMVISLHACDTATDYALFNALKWNSRYIFCVPCCQHELNKQISSCTYPLLFRHGIIKERISSLMTDTIRATILELYGYKTQIMEFVDFAHSPKNLLIRAVRNDAFDKNSAQYTKTKNELDSLLQSFDLHPTLCKLVDIS